MSVQILRLRSLLASFLYYYHCCLQLIVNNNCKASHQKLERLPWRFESSRTYKAYVEQFSFTIELL